MNYKSDRARGTFLGKSNLHGVVFEKNINISNKILRNPIYIRCFKIIKCFSIAYSLANLK